MKASYYAVLCNVFLLEVCAAGERPECNRSQEDEVLLLQTDLKLSAQISTISGGRSRSEADSVHSQQRNHVVSLLGKAQDSSTTGLVASSSRSNPDIWLILLVIAVIVILVPVVIVSITEMVSPPQNASAELQESSRGKGQAGMTTTSQRQLRVTYSERFQERGESSRELKLPPNAQVSLDPPPICPSLVLPTNEARFMISLDLLQAVMQGLQGTMDICGLSGQKLLHGVLEDVPGLGRRLSIASVRCELDPRATIVPRNSFCYVLYGRDRQEYGTLECVGGRIMLKQAGNPVMVLDAGDPNELHYTASRMDGRVLASAGRQPNPLEGQEENEIWRLQVRPGIDAILVLTCMLAIMLLRPRPADGTITPSLPGFTPRERRDATLPLMTPRGSVASLPRRSATGRNA